MSAYTTEDRPHTGYYPPPSSSSHGRTTQALNEIASPRALPSSHGYPQGFVKGPPPQSPYRTPEVPPGSSHGYPPQPPVTPISGQPYPPQPPSSAGQYYGLVQTAVDLPSPPPTSHGRPVSGEFTSDGVPIVPVGISGGKMFRCRGYGECDKVFTRSEHLARHVRKHTGERPFPCHCGKAFSRLDNLRQHSATVHADQGTLNEAMLNSLAPVHAALSQRANREQRKRGEIVEVPKNAVERPRHNETYRHGKNSPGSAQMTASPYAHQHEQLDWGTAPMPHGRPRTSGGSDYQYAFPPESYPPHGVPGDGSGPSRRPPSSGYPPQPLSYGEPRPMTAPDTASSGGSMSQLPYPYRPMSSNGRELPVPAHYAESEPPSTAHGPPQSPMYPPGVPPTQWSSPPTHNFPHGQSHYPSQPEGYAYPEHPPSYGPPPPGSSANTYSYPAPTGYYSASQYGSVPPPQTGQYGPPYPSPHGPESPFQYHAPQHELPYGYNSRKRRAEDWDDPSRKHGRTSGALPHPHPEHLGEAMGEPRQHESDWLPPTVERRSSLAISALLGSPQQITRSRPVTANIQTHQQMQPAYVLATPTAAYPPVPYGPAPTSSTGSASMPATPGMNGTIRSPVQMRREGEMEQKARALLEQQS